ncbi:MAG TPA: hypothetical protein VGX94_14110 [Terriglobia bacterium]|nr:hypothetical protein [Terriglobia bacterium]
MAKRFAVPKFRSEAEEAKWWDSHATEAQEEISRQIKAGTAIIVRKGQPNPSELSQVCIRLSKSDVDAARRLAAEEGLGYQPYIRALLHKALRREASRR